MSNNFFSNYDQNTKDFWENCDETFAHLSIDKWLGDYESLTSYWDKKFINLLNLNEATVAEYGIGGGYLGKYLFESKGISHYVGIDISDRSLKKSSETLKAFQSRISLHSTSFELSSIIADVFVSQACIQHFPDVSYFEVFLSKLNKAKLKYIVLQYRYSGNTFCTKDSPVFSLFTNAFFIKDRLTNFFPINVTGIEQNGYQYLVLARVDQTHLPKIDIENAFGFYELNYFKDHYRLKAVEKKLLETGGLKNALKAYLKKTINRFRS
jgi:hypothetical protein